MTTLTKEPKPPNDILLIIFFTALALVLCVRKCTAQQCNSITLSTGQVLKLNSNITSGNCISPDGVDHIITYSPSSYQQLLDSGYCYSIGPVKTFTACYTFTAPSPSVSLNTGYSSSGCVTTSFSNINLYSCSPSCVLIGSGVTFTNLTTGNCYTWCFSGKCTGIFATGFDHICPYYQDLTVVPVTFLDINVTPYMAYNQLEWITATEVNCKGYILETSKDCLKWLEMAYIECNNHNNSTYNYNDTKYNNGLVYYRVKEVDFNNNTMFSKIIFSCSSPNKLITNIVNELNQPVNIDYQGVKLIYYEDGSINKIK